MLLITLCLTVEANGLSYLISLDINWDNERLNLELSATLAPHQYKQQPYDAYMLVGYVILSFYV